MHTVSRDEIAGWLGLAPSSAPRRIRVLIDSHGFPRPLPGFATRWSRHLVVLWLSSNGGAFRPEAANDEGPVDPVAAHRSYLESRGGPG
jgi:hypothetical protein